MANSRQHLTEQVYQDTQGVYRWNSNHRVPSMTEAEYTAYGFYHLIGFNYTKQKEAKIAEDAIFIARYREQMKGRKRTDEEMAELRANFEPGTVIVDVFTGERTQL